MDKKNPTRLACTKPLMSSLCVCGCRGAYSYVKRVTRKNGKTEFAAKFISARGKRKALALREMELLSELDNERILYFHDAFEKKNVVVLITDLYPFTRTYSEICNLRFTEKCFFLLHLRFTFYLLHCRTKVHLNASQVQDAQH